MSNRHSISINDDELNEWFENASDQVFGGKSATVVMALRTLKREKGDEIDDIMIEGEDRDVLV